jgi:hypothetical protein
VTGISLSFCHDVIVLGRREEYHVWATLRTAMTKDFAMTAAVGDLFSTSMNQEQGNTKY